MINDRIALLIDALRLTQNRFSAEIKVSPAVIHNITKARRSKPGFEILEKILLTYKDVSADWLLRGEGRIWVKHSDLLYKNQTSSDELETRIIRLIETMRSGKSVSNEAYELTDLIEILIDTSRGQKRKLIKLHERQEEIIRTLKTLKTKL